MHTVMNIQCPYNGWNLLNSGGNNSLRKGTVLQELVGWMGGWMDGWVSEWVVGWMDGWVSEWVDGWMDGWMGG